jgi:hypothetical protein
MTAGVVTVGRHRYAVGLYWENSPGTGRVAQIAKEAAKQPGQQADFYVVRPGNKDGRVPQFGLTSSETGQAAGMPVLAACLATQIPGSWVGAFRLNEGVVVTVVRDDLIVPDGDLFFADEAGARDRLIQEVGFGGLQTIYAPEAWSIPGADSIPLTLLLSDQADIQLQRVSISKKTKIIAASLTLVLGLILAAVWIHQEKVEEERERLSQQQEALARAKQATRVPSLFSSKVQPEAKYIRKWENAPPVLAIINACKDGLSHVPSALAGWRLSSLTCDGSSINLSWNREKEATTPPPGTKVSETGAIATQAVPLPPLNPRGAETLENSDEITNRYLLQNWPGPISHASDDPPPLPPAGYTGPWNPPPAPWIKRSFTLSVPELPGGLPEWIGDLPGVVINNMNCAFGKVGCAWTVEGVIYENRK